MKYLANGGSTTTQSGRVRLGESEYVLGFARVPMSRDFSANLPHLALSLESVEIPTRSVEKFDIEVGD